MKPEGCLMETSEKTLVTGRRLDGDGNPIDGTGFEYAAEGPIAEALAARTAPVYSNPVTGEWGIKLADGTDTDGEYVRGVGVFRAGHAGPPDHLHPTYAEHFEVLQGKFRFKRGDEELHLEDGDRIVVPSGTRHSFRNVGDGFGSFTIEARPAGRFAEFIPLVYGLGHDGKLTAAGVPRLLQAVVIARALDNDTVYLTPPPVIMRPVSRVLGPVAQLLGYQASYDRYLSDEFWEQRVEQP